MRRRWRPALFVVLLAVSGFLAYLAAGSDPFAWDRPVAEWTVGISVSGFRGAMEAVSIPGTTLGVLLSLAVATAAVLAWRGWRAASVVAAVILANALNVGLKAVVGRPRPGGLGEFNSFPSGHVVHTVVFLGVLWALIAPRLPPGAPRIALGAVMGTAVVLVGVSRIHLERHWPSDVLGGYVVGALALWALLWVARGFLGRPNADATQEGERHARRAEDEGR